MSSIVSSEESRKAYVKRKEQVLDLLKNASELYRDEDPDKAEVFNDLYKNLEDGEFSIVIVGEFSAGKSTLLNALMGQRILPSFSNETTATVNFLRHTTKAKEGEKGRVFYNDGTQVVIEDISLDTIMNYVSTKGNDVAQTVDHLDLYLDSDFLRDGVTLVDSPGLNGIADNHREITEAQILKSHACIFVFNSDHPGSKTDFEFLHELQKKVKTIIFVLNKIDEIKIDEGETPESVVDSLKQSYKKKFPEETTVPEIWPVAAYPALVARNSDPIEYHEKTNRTEDEKKELEKSSRLTEFENRLMSFLTCGEKAKQQLLSPVERVIALSVDKRKDYENEKAMLENAVDSTELENQMAAIRESIDGIENQILSSKTEITKEIRDTIRDIREELNAEMSRLQDRKLAEIDQFDDFEELVEYLQKFEKSFIQNVYSIARNQEENLREMILSVINARYSAQAGIIESGLNEKNIDIKLEVMEHLSTGNRSFEVGLKEMEEKTRSLEVKLQTLTNEAQKAEDDYYKARKLEKKKNELKNEILTLKEKRDMVETQMLPPIERFTEDVTKKEHRGGILGTIGYILFGAKSVVHQELREDRKDHDNAQKSKDEQMSALNGEIAFKQEQLENLGDEDLEIRETIQLRKMAAADAVREELVELTKENTRKIELKNQKEIKKIKYELTEYCDTITNELNNQVKKALRNSEHAYIEVVIDAIAGSLKSNLKERQNRLEQIERQMKVSEENKNARIINLEGKIQSINELIDKASDLQTDLEMIPIDQIRQEII